MLWCVWIASAALLGLVAANLVARRMFRYAENLRDVDPIVRQVFWSQHLFLELLLLGMAALCVLFPTELHSSDLGRALSAFLSVFWGVRFLMQFLHYSSEQRRRFPVMDALFSLCFLYLACLFGVLACGLWI